MYLLAILSEKNTPGILINWVEQYSWWMLQLIKTLPLFACLFIYLIFFLA